MAGIGFELKKMLQDDSWMGLSKAYVYAGFIGSGPWVLSIVGIVLVGLVNTAGQEVGQIDYEVWKFMTSVTYLMSGSLVVSSALQLVFTRFISDQLYLGNDDVVLPNLLGALSVCSIFTGSIGLLVVFFLFGDDWVYMILFLVCFVLLCNMWIILVLMSGVKRYKPILGAFFISYLCFFIMGYALRGWGCNGLMLAFFLSHMLLVIIILYQLLQEFLYTSGEIRLSLGFLNPTAVHPILIFVGVFYNLGVWIDKWIFWANPSTSESVSGFLRASVIYDLPVFLAYLSIIPGMASFLLRIETDFVERYQDYYSAINEGGSFSEIKVLRGKMVQTIITSLWEIIKLQGVTALIFILLVPEILQWLGVSILYAPLYYMLLLATAVQVIYLSLLNIMFYFNFLRLALWMTFGLFALNGLFTFFTVTGSPVFFGYGFALALLIMSVFGLVSISVNMNRLEYLTFMMQR